MSDNFNTINPQTIMGLIHSDTFVCFDCESTGLDPENDRLIEIAATTFTFNEIQESLDTLVNPGIPIPAYTTEIHHITDKMVAAQPYAADIVSKYLTHIQKHPIIGHGITFDIKLLHAEALRAGIHSKLNTLPYIDTLRMARLYGESPTNSLEALRKHFNIQELGAHRAKNDVITNIKVFKFLSKKFKTTQSLFERLKQPIALKLMPLGKHKGRLFRDIPETYLRWAAHQDFDQDLLFSIRSELKKRKKGSLFSQVSNPFNSL